MTHILYEIHHKTACITLNRSSKNNAFDNLLLTDLHKYFNQANDDPSIRVIILKANGNHFSAGADIAWMQKMTDYSEEQNLADALVLGDLMYSIHHSPKPTIAMVQGSAFGGGAGLVAACDVGIATDNAQFCFSEVKLGLIPAVISPYVIHSIGEKNAKMLFMSAELFNAQRALNLGLIQYCVTQELLFDTALNYANQISANAPEAVSAAKKLVLNIASKEIDSHLVTTTAKLIAHKRVSQEGQQGLKAFLNKEQPNWN